MKQINLFRGILQQHLQWDVARLSGRFKNEVQHSLKTARVQSCGLIQYIPDYDFFSAMLAVSKH